MNVRIGYKATEAKKGTPYQETTFGALSTSVHHGPTEKMEPTIHVRGGAEHVELEVQFTLFEFRGILAAVVAESAFPGLNHNDLVAAGRVISACIAALAEPQPSPE